MSARTDRSEFLARLDILVTEFMAEFATDLDIREVAPVRESVASRS